MEKASMKLDKETEEEGKQRIMSMESTADIKKSPDGVESMLGSNAITNLT